MKGCVWGGCVCRGGVSYSVMASSDGYTTPDPCERILGEGSAACDDESQSSRGGDDLTQPAHPRRLNFINTNSFFFLQICFGTSPRLLPSVTLMRLTFSTGEDGDIGLGVNISRSCSYSPI